MTMHRAIMAMHRILDMDTVARFCSCLFFATLGLFLTSPVSSTGMELCHRNHIFTVDNVVNGTSVTYTNSHTSDTSTITIDDHFLPTTTVCGRGHERCNLIITLNNNRTILVVTFPLERGLGMVSYDVTINDTLDFREKTVVTQILRQCTFMYLLNIETVTDGFCLNTTSSSSMLYSIAIAVDYNNLSSSYVHEPDNIMIREQIYNIASLSNLIFLSQKGGRCFLTEGGHVVFMESGYLVRYSLSNHQFHNHVEIDASCVSTSMLTAINVPGRCEVAAQCRGVLSFVDVKSRQKKTPIFTEDEFGQLFPCPDRRFLGFRNMTLTVYTDNGHESGTTDFPVSESILYGECATMNQQVVFIATLNDSSTVLVNLSGSSNTSSCRRRLGESDLSRVSAKVVDDLAFVNNDNESLVYDLGTKCIQESIPVPGNFILATIFTTRTIDVCRCPPNLSPISPSSTLPLPTSSPTIDPSSESQVNPIAIAVPVGAAVLVLVCTLVIAFLIIRKKKLCVQSKEERRSSTVDGRNGGFPLLPKEQDSSKCNSEVRAVDGDSAKPLLEDSSTPVPLDDSDEHIAHPPCGGCCTGEKQQLKLLANYDDTEGYASGRTEPESETVLGQNEERVPEPTGGSSYRESFGDACCTQPHSAEDESHSQFYAGSLHCVKHTEANPTVTGNHNYQESGEYRSVSPDNGVTPQLETAVRQGESSYMVVPMSRNSSAAILPEHVAQNCRNMTDRENQQPFRDAMDAISESSDSPNNDINVNRQLSTSSEESES